MEELLARIILDKLREYWETQDNLCDSIENICSRILDITNMNQNINFEGYFSDNLKRWLSYLGNENAKFLIIWSAPWSRTLRSQPMIGNNIDYNHPIYYADKRNKFWETMSDLSGENIMDRRWTLNPIEKHERQLAFCTKYKIALWDRVKIFFSIKWSSRDDKRIPIVYNKIVPSDYKIVISNWLKWKFWTNDSMNTMYFQNKYRFNGKNSFIINEWTEFIFLQSTISRNFNTEIRRIPQIDDIFVR